MFQFINRFLFYIIMLDLNIEYYTRFTLYNEFLELCNNYYEINSNYIEIYRKFENIYSQENLNNLSKLIEEILNAKDEIEKKHKKIIRRLNKVKRNIKNNYYYNDKEKILLQISNIEIFINDYKNTLGKKIIEFKEYRKLREHDILEYNTLNYLNDISLDQIKNRDEGKIDLEESELSFKNFNFDLFNNQII